MYLTNIPACKQAYESGNQRLIVKL